jgi:hypothetical protein
MKFPTLSDLYTRDGHRFESPQPHQEVRTSEVGSVFQESLEVLMG